VTGVRALTESEARVLALLLGNTARDERERLRQSGLARSTYHATRRRAYAEGWLKDRYVPSPGLFGRPRVRIVVVRPFADRIAEIVQLWQGRPENVVTWVGPQFALGVFFEPPSAGRGGTAPRADASLSTPLVEVAAEPDRGGLPVYFDFEGVWSHLAGFGGTRAYPKGLPPTPAGSGEGGADPWTARRRWAARELLERPFRAEREGRAGHLIGPFGLPSAEKQLLAEGWVLHRVLADPARIPPYQGRQMDRIVLATGRLRPEISAADLFVTLTGSCRVFPFLYATDDRTLLLGALGQSPLPGAPAPADPRARRPVMPTLRSALEGIQIVEESAANLAVPVDHRYDRLAPPEPAARRAR
jgi:hypothetical protein